MFQARSRVSTVLAATAVAVGLSIGVGAGSAAAAPRLTTDTIFYQDGKSVVVSLYADGKYAGAVTWNADPLGDKPGDALQAYDGGADGWGVMGTVTDPWIYRSASTAGHASPYTTKWVTGDLTEDTWLDISVCLVKGSQKVCDYNLPRVSS
ncbi:hypothetical protein [Streptomyces griseosporeus]